MDFRGKRVAILGLGIEGRDALGFLAGQGAQVVVFDKKNRDELDIAEVGSEKWEVRNKS